MAKQPSGGAFKRLKLGENEKRVIIPGLAVNEPHNERGGVLDNWEHSDFKTKHRKGSPVEHWVGREKKEKKTIRGTEQTLVWHCCLVRCC